MLSKYPLTPQELFKIEHKTIELLKSNAKLQEHSSEIFSDCESLCAKQSDMVKNINKKHYFKNISSLNIFKFDTWIESEDKLFKIFFGGMITLKATKTEYERITYYVAIVDKNNTVIRKIHFDYQIEPNIPFYHIQYSGRINGYLKDKLALSKEKLEENEKRLGSHLDIPRLPYMPMSFIQLVSLIVKEYLPSKASSIIDNNWYGHLRSSENKLYSNFHDVCSKALKNDKSLLMDCYYLLS